MAKPMCGTPYCCKANTCYTNAAKIYSCDDGKMTAQLDKQPAGKHCRSCNFLIYLSLSSGIKQSPRGNQTSDTAVKSFLTTQMKTLQRSMRNRPVRLNPFVGQHTCKCFLHEISGPRSFCTMPPTFVSKRVLKGFLSVSNIKLCYPAYWQTLQCWLCLHRRGRLTAAPWPSLGG